MTSSPLTSIGDVRDAISSFVEARDWAQFHTPRNIALALSGEVGEISEIFQWKGPLEEGLNENFSSRDIEHIGEELADVFIYTTRLADLSGANLSSAVFHVAKNGERTQIKSNFIQKIRCTPGAIWKKEEDHSSIITETRS